MPKKTTKGPAPKRTREKKTRPIIESDFDVFCNRIADGPIKLKPSTRCRELLRRCIHKDEHNGKRSCFEDFTELVNNSASRDSLISEIVASWFHQQYMPMWEEYWRDHAIFSDPKFLLRLR
jgi:hypothetical protein